MSGKTAATYVLAFSLFSLAASLVYFTVQMSTISKQIPEILTLVEDTSSQVGPVVKEVGQIRDLIPPILNEVAQTREQIPKILEEIRLSREQIPFVLEEVKNTRQHIPAILETANKVSDTVVVAVKEVEKIRPLVPKVLTQVEKTREAIPGMLNKTEQLIGQAREAGKKASKGAVTGVLTGIITAPFVLIGSAGKKFMGLGSEEGKELTDQDIELIHTTVMKVLALKDVNEFREWKNPDNNHRGKVTLKTNSGGLKEQNGTQCKEVLMEVWVKDKSILDNLTTYCPDKDNGWSPKE